MLYVHSVGLCHVSCTVRPTVAVWHQSSGGDAMPLYAQGFSRTTVCSYDILLFDLS